jgi:N-acetylglucosamine kinase-like BadF-type ATPase
VALFLGVDGGGSKTAFVLLDETGRTLAQAVGPSSYYFASGLHTVTVVLQDGIARLAEAAGVRTDEIDYAFFGLPGYGEIPADTPRLDAIPRGVLGHDRYLCDNDMIGGWAGALGGEDGINVVAGTGSMAYGERRGVGRRVGGWGELFGDEGSAYWVAIRGLNAFTRMSDGRQPRGPLYDIVKTRVGTSDDLGVVGVIVDGWRGARSEIADLSKAVVEADAAGDPAASAILAEGSRELARLVETARTALGYEDGEQAPVSYSGGMFSAASYLDGFAAALDALGPGYRRQAPIFGPGIGSALYAMKQHGTALPARVLDAR